ncbi:MAG: RnfH family protein [Betaproteobacteria bacterium]|nr:RnfH family protein [Betaproteobacteria bacterium]
MAITVEVVSPPEAVTLRLSEGATLADAVAASGFTADGMKTGIHGRIAGRETVLEDGDRVEIYRPLRLDAKEARRRRASAGRAGRKRV